MEELADIFRELREGLLAINAEHYTRLRAIVEAAYPVTTTVQEVEVEEAKREADLMQPKEALAEMVSETLTGVVSPLTVTVEPTTETVEEGPKLALEPMLNISRPDLEFLDLGAQRSGGAPAKGVENGGGAFAKMGGDTMAGFSLEGVEATGGCEVLSRASQGADRECDPPDRKVAAVAVIPAVAVVAGELLGGLAAGDEGAAREKPRAGERLWAKKALMGQESMLGCGGLLTPAGLHQSGPKLEKLGHRGGSSLSIGARAGSDLKATAGDGELAGDGGGAATVVVGGKRGSVAVAEENWAAGEQIKEKKALMGSEGKLGPKGMHMQTWPTPRPKHGACSSMSRGSPRRRRGSEPWSLGQRRRRPMVVRRRSGRRVDQRRALAERTTRWKAIDCVEALDHVSLIKTTMHEPWTVYVKEKVVWATSTVAQVEARKELQSEQVVMKTGPEVLSTKSMECATVAELRSKWAFGEGDSALGNKRKMQIGEDDSRSSNQGKTAEDPIAPYPFTKNMNDGKWQKSGCLAGCFLSSPDLAVISPGGMDSEGGVVRPIGGGELVDGGGGTTGGDTTRLVGCRETEENFGDSGLLHSRLTKGLLGDFNRGIGLGDLLKKGCSTRDIGWIFEGGVIGRSKGSRELETDELGRATMRTFKPEAREVKIERNCGVNSRASFTMPWRINTVFELEDKLKVEKGSNDTAPEFRITSFI